MKKFIVFNWKMHPATQVEAVQLAQLTNNQQLTIKNKKIEIVVCPPFVFLDRLSSAVGRGLSVKLGAQDVSAENPLGPYTGEISAEMLKNVGVRYVIIGHSERRCRGETDEVISRKVKAALESGLTVIVCVGESRRQSFREAKTFVKKQLERDLSQTNRSTLTANRLIVAYEPIWAISTTKGGKDCTPQAAAEMISFIKDYLYVKRYALDAHSMVLYGGSVNGRNIKGFAREKNIDGVLVGGASLKKGEIKKIINAVKKYGNV